jgi:hypothetical protein
MDTVEVAIAECTSSGLRASRTATNGTGWKPSSKRWRRRNSRVRTWKPFTKPPERRSRNDAVDARSAVRTGAVGVGTKHAADAALGFQERLPTLAHVEVETRVQRHRFDGLMGAVRAGDRSRLQDQPCPIVSGFDEAAVQWRTLFA